MFLQEPDPDALWTGMNNTTATHDIDSTAISTTTRPGRSITGRRLATLGIALSLAGAACASDATSDADTGLEADPVSIDESTVGDTPASSDLGADTAGVPSEVDDEPQPEPDAEAGGAAEPEIEAAAEATAPTSGPCGSFDPIPGDAMIGSDDLLDLNDDGELERLVTYHDGAEWKLRQEWYGAVSEIALPGDIDSDVGLIGLADVAAFGGDEILVRVGGVPTAVEIGVFSSFEGPCLFRFQHDEGGDAGFFVEVGSYWVSGMTCNDGSISTWGYQEDGPGTYGSMGGTYTETATGHFGFELDSDAYAEGVPADQVPQILFDCNGLTL